MSPSRCQAAHKGVRNVPAEYRESRRAEDQEAGPAERQGSGQCGGTAALRPVGGGAATGEISALISTKKQFPYILMVYTIGNDVLQDICIFWRDTMCVYLKLFPTS